MVMVTFQSNKHKLLDKSKLVKLSFSRIDLNFDIPRCAPIYLAK